MIALSLSNCSGKLLADGSGAFVATSFVKRNGVAYIVAACARRQPLAKPRDKILVGEILAPERRIFHAGLGERAVQIQHADQTGPGARPIGDGENRAVMSRQPGQHVMRILPDRLGDDERRLRIDRSKDFDPLALRRNETVPNVFLVRMCPHDLETGRRDRAAKALFHFRLGRPALLICRQPQISASDELNLLRR